MKIGILTFWGVPNYGAFAQAYALNKLLKQLYAKADVKHLAYLHPCHQNLYFRKKKPVVTSYKSLLSPYYYINLLVYYTRPRNKYPSFVKDWKSIEHVNLKSEIELENYDCDVIITGSDAIWEYSIAEFGDDVHLIGNRLKGKKIVSYAASFGNMNPEDYFKPFIKEGLEKYSAISVRDETSQIIVKKILQKDKAVFVLDPTLVWNFKADENIPESPYSKYILVYGNDFPNELVKKVKTYAMKEDLTIVGAGIAPQWCDVRLTDIGPKAWIGLFKKANFVVTCTFHGLMFSINYEKKVLFNQVEYVKNRSTALLDKIGLLNLYENGADLDTVLNYNWDYGQINSKLEKLRSESLKFIGEQCENE